MAAVRIQFALMAAAAIALMAAEAACPVRHPAQPPGHDADRDANPGVAPAPGAESKLDPAYRHQMVLYNTSETPGTIIIDTSERFLYLIQPNNRAWRYGIGVGRDGLGFRLANHEIVDLYPRVPVGTKVIVQQ
jgi:lipoprotein-anchoring transpeptidase ErfK/SrfK